jgi:stalled ribosome rescue protein Dom34
MKTVKKRLGIWMDHSMAHLMEFSETPFEIETIESKFTHEEKEKKLAKGESFMHHKEQQMHSDYFKKIAKVILNYDKILLFGPTNAKTELFNILSEDNRYVKIKICIIDTDKMNAHQRQSFIVKHFSSPLYN